MSNVKVNGLANVIAKDRVYEIDNRIVKELINTSIGIANVKQITYTMS